MLFYIEGYLNELWFLVLEMAPLAFTGAHFCGFAESLFSTEAH
jgi:hypothetical protein